MCPTESGRTARQSRSPLDPALGVRDIQSAFYYNGLLAATADGIYRRDRATFRWEKISLVAARHISSYAATIWIVPEVRPEQIWASTDGGATWKRWDEGLEGTVIAPVHVYTDLAYATMTLRDKRYVIWTSDLEGPWREFATVPGPAVAVGPGSIRGSFSMQVAPAPEVLAGSGDGNTYRLIDVSPPHSVWQGAHRFGRGRYPLFLARNKLSVVELWSGTMQLGGHLDECDQCGVLRISYNSCRNRYCPKCGALSKAR